MKARHFLHSDGAIATGLSLEAVGMLLALGAACPALGVGLAVAGVILLAATLTTGGEHHE